MPRKNYTANWRAQVKLATGGNALVEMGEPVYNGDIIVVATGGAFVMVLASKAVAGLRVVGRVVGLAGNNAGNSFLLRALAGLGVKNCVQRVFCRAIKQAGARRKAGDYVTLLKYVAQRYSRQEEARELVA